MSRNNYERAGNVSEFFGSVQIRYSLTDFLLRLDLAGFLACEEKTEIGVYLMKVWPEVFPTEQPGWEIQKKCLRYYEVYRKPFKIMCRGERVEKRNFVIETLISLEVLSIVGKSGSTLIEKDRLKQEVRELLTQVVTDGPDFQRRLDDILGQYLENDDAILAESTVHLIRTHMDVIEKLTDELIRDLKERRSAGKDEFGGRRGDRRREEEARENGRRREDRREESVFPDIGDRKTGRKEDRPDGEIAGRRSNRNREWLGGEIAGRRSDRNGERPNEETAGRGSDRSGGTAGRRDDRNGERPNGETAGRGSDRSEEIGGRRRSESGGDRLSEETAGRRNDQNGDRLSGEDRRSGETIGNTGDRSKDRPAGEAAGRREDRAWDGRTEGERADRTSSGEDSSRRGRLPRREYQMKYVRAACLLYQALTKPGDGRSREERLKEQWPGVFEDVPYSQEALEDISRFIASDQGLAAVNLLFDYSLKEIRGGRTVRRIVADSCVWQVLAKLPHGSTEDMVINEAVTLFGRFSGLSVGKEEEDIEQFLRKFLTEEGTVSEDVSRFLWKYEPAISDFYRMALESVNSADTARKRAWWEEEINRKEKEVSDLQSQMASVRMNTVFDIVSKLTSSAYDYTLSRLFRFAQGYDTMSEKELRMEVNLLLQVLQLYGVKADAAELLDRRLSDEECRGARLSLEVIPDMEPGYVTFPGWSVAGDTVTLPVACKRTEGES